MPSIAKSATHTPGDVNHQFLGHAGYDFCYDCGVSLRGKRTFLETEMLEALTRAHLYFIQSNSLSVDDREMLDEMWAAIQKAKGGQ